MTLGTVIAERAYEWRTPHTTRRIVLLLGRPVRDPAPGGDWICPVQFRPATGGLPRGARGIAGVDPLQAILLAVGFAELHLRLLERGGGGTLTWLGMEDVGLPGVIDWIERQHPARASAFDHRAS